MGGGGQSLKVKVGTFGLPLVLGLQFHCLKKGILAVEGPVLLVSVNSPLTLGGQRERVCNKHLMSFSNIISATIYSFSRLCS